MNDSIFFRELLIFFHEFDVYDSWQSELKRIFWTEKILFITIALLPDEKALCASFHGPIH